MNRFLLVLSVLLLGACASGTDSTDQAVRFLVIGDFGTGQPPQYLVADAMNQVCAERGCDFVVTTGDNIYDNGAFSANDPQFVLNFELPYLSLDLPWYLTLGNHDVGDDPLVGGDRGHFEVEYSHRTDRVSEKWNMPERFYEVRKGAVSLLMLDTNRISNDGVTGFDDSTWASEQRPWLLSAIANSDATWKFAFGHHPYHSNGGHANAPEEYQARLRETICGTTDALFTGHDHVMEWLVQSDDCPGTELVISGGGGQTPDLTSNPPQNESYYEVIQTYGFLHVEVVGLTWTGTFYDQNAEPLFQRTVMKTGAQR